MINKLPKRQKQDKYTKSAQGQECQIRSPFCNHNPETVVFCHLNGAGIGEKMQNIHGAYGCSKCHDFVDNRICSVSAFNHHQRHYYHLEGTIKTQELMIRNGVLKL
jgi:hypothetical protein